MILLETKDTREKKKPEVLFFHDKKDLGNYNNQKTKDSLSEKEESLPDPSSEAEQAEGEHLYEARRTDITAAEYYREWIREHLGSAVNIIDVPIDETKLADALTTTLDTIRKLYDEIRNKDAWRLWVDTHGGFRDFSTVIVSAAKFFATDKR